MIGAIKRSSICRWFHPSEVDPWESGPNMAKLGLALVECIATSPRFEAHECVKNLSETPAVPPQPTKDGAIFYLKAVESTLDSYIARGTGVVPGVRAFLHNTRCLVCTFAVEAAVRIADGATRNRRSCCEGLRIARIKEFVTPDDFDILCARWFVGEMMAYAGDRALDPDAEQAAFAMVMADNPVVAAEIVGADFGEVIDRVQPIGLPF